MVVLAAVLVTGAGWLGGRNAIIKTAIESIVGKKIGLPLYLGRVRSDIFLNRIEIYGVTVENPPGYNRRLFIYLPRVTVLTGLSDLFLGDRLNLHLLDFQIETVNVIRRADGRVNLSDISGRAGKGKRRGRKISMELMRYDIKDAFFYDEADKQASVRAYAIDVYDLTFSHADSFSDVVDSVIQEVTAKAKLGETLNFVAVRFLGNISNLKAVPSQFADQAAKKAGHIFARLGLGKEDIGSGN
ncbi:MAG: hypothetical protein Q8R76_06375 [Candidatus Omnitrophota bacterium]|nr:hypothetical protein [Candidatus Omnitrophota bacterium]